MSSAGRRERYLYDNRNNGHYISSTKWANGERPLDSLSSIQVGKQITVSESHPRDRKDGSYREGGPFYTSLVSEYFEPGYWPAAYISNRAEIYRGPVVGSLPTEAEMKEVGYKNLNKAFGDKNESQLLIAGTNAISYCNPINPASQLGTSLSESYLEGLPTLPGIKLWRDRTQFLKGLGSEYLNYQFGWAPLHQEVKDVVSAARHHRDLLQQYHRGEGSDTHRTFEFPIENFTKVLPAVVGVSTSQPAVGIFGEKSTRQVGLVRSTKKWFEGCFTYGLPSSTDSWRKALGFGSDADQLFGLALSPDILWELTPWSWAVDWFSNAGEVINNVTNFGLAGLVLRYGYIMEESIEDVYAEGSGWSFQNVDRYSAKDGFVTTQKPSGNWRRGYKTITKRRYPASPFGFSVGWEGLSPTQLAITAALGITRLL